MIHAPLKNKSIKTYSSKGTYIVQYEHNDVASAVALHLSRKEVVTIGKKECVSCKKLVLIYFLTEEGRRWCRDCCIRHDFADVVEEKNEG